MCFGVNVHVSGAGPRNISETLTQSWLFGLARSVSAFCALARLPPPPAGGRTEFVTAPESWGTLVDPRGKSLEQADRDVTVLERECFAEVAARLVHPDRVRSEMGQAVFSVLSTSQPGGRGVEGNDTRAYLANKLEALSRANVPFSTFLDFSEDPWLDECTASDHDPVHAGSVDLFPVILGGETIAPAKDRDR